MVNVGSRKSKTTKAQEVDVGAPSLEILVTILRKTDIPLRWIWTTAKCWESYIKRCWKSYNQRVWKPISSPTNGCLNFLRSFLSLRCWKWSIALFPQRLVFQVQSLRSWSCMVVWFGGDLRCCFKYMLVWIWWWSFLNASIFLWSCSGQLDVKLLIFMGIM